MRFSDRLLPDKARRVGTEERMMGGRIAPWVGDDSVSPSLFIRSDKDPDTIIREVTPHFILMDCTAGCHCCPLLQAAWQLC